MPADGTLSYLTDSDGRMPRNRPTADRQRLIRLQSPRPHARRERGIAERRCLSSDYGSPATDSNGKTEGARQELPLQSAFFVSGSQRVACIRILHCLRTRNYLGQFRQLQYDILHPC